ncbi:DNA binding protein [Brochothrix phage A9]|uniref:Gp169 n=1 Tax=Brochothrix phage A9 TaxID=857312 RepID=D9J0W8_9CAUD|nr:DNA binding protein [Brochothrix phage A9]ADJ53204.1 gp169 [Brochothrix phage A9]
MPTYQPITRDISKRAVEMYLSGDLRADIVSELNISVGSLYRILTRHKVPLRKKRASSTQAMLDKYTEREQREIARRYVEDGVKISDLTSGYGLTLSTFLTIVDMYAPDGVIVGGTEVVPVDELTTDKFIPLGEIEII